MGLTFTTGILIGYLFEIGNQKRMVLKNSNVHGGSQLLSNHSLMGDMLAQSHITHLRQMQGCLVASVTQPLLHG